MHNILKKTTVGAGLQCTFGGHSTLQHDSHLEEAYTLNVTHAVKIGRLPLLNAHFENAGSLPVKLAIKGFNTF